MKTFGMQQLDHEHYIYNFYKTFWDTCSDKWHILQPHLGRACFPFYQKRNKLRFNEWKFTVTTEQFYKRLPCALCFVEFHFNFTDCSEIHRISLKFSCGTGPNEQISMIDIFYLVNKNEIDRKNLMKVAKFQNLVAKC